MAKKPEIIDNTTLHNVTVENVMSDAFGKYAKYIIQDRAIPDIRDGLKPVQRRIIYAMNDLGITHDKPHKKSARSVGEVIGKYHPHGDTSIYDAMVRMSQDWKNTCPLIDMHGNNGSLDNDPAAAMRYTESRLSAYAETMVSNIKKNTVNFIENFDGSEIEPTVLPSLLPNLLLNGAQGIAAGYATNIPTFNLIELLDSAIARIDSPNCRLETIMNIMPGPDFPTKGIILNNSDIRGVYETGRGKIIVRATMEQVGKRQIYVRDIPYETVKCDIIDQINVCAEEVESLGIDIARDESDSSGVCICIEMKPNFNYDLVKNYLYKNTSLQVNYNANMISIKDRKPYMMTILGYLDAYIAHVNDVIVKSTQYDLDKAKIRREIVTGLIKAISIIDDVVSLIRRSSDKADAKNGLINKMHFSELQSEAIVSLRLYKLSNTDLDGLRNELKELELIITEYELILNDKSYRDNKIKAILRGYKKEFGVARQTQFSNESSTDIKIEVADVIEDRANYLVITKDGYLKNIPTKSFAASEYSELKIKEGDVPVAQFESNQRNKLILITSKGNYVSIPVFKIESTK
jgi:topoisomerase-4 subunit A